MKFRKPLAWVLCLALGTPASAQTEPKKGSQVLEDLEKQMHLHYPTVLATTYDRIVINETTRRLGDFHNALGLTSAGLADVFLQLNYLNSIVQKDAAEGWSEKRFYSTNWVRHSAKKLVRQVKQLGINGTALGEYWNRRCSESTLKSYVDFYDPVVMFPRDNFGPDIELHKPDIYVGVQIQTYNNGQMGSGTGTGVGGGTDEEGEAIVATTTVVGGVIGSFFGPVGTLVGSVIGALVGSLINLFRGAFDAHNEFEAQQKVQERIRDFMISETEALAQKRKSIFESACQTGVTEDQNSAVIKTVGLIQQKQSLALQSTQQLSDYLESEFAAFPEKLVTHLRTIESGYLAELTSKMTENQDALLNNLIELDKRAFEFQRISVVPQIKSERSADSSLMRLEARDQLWRMRITGDVVFSQLHDGTNLEPERLGEWLENSEHIKDILREAI